MGVFGEAGITGLMRWVCWFPIVTVTYTKKVVP